MEGKIVDAFFALLRAGLWEQNVRLSPFFPIDIDALYKLAEEQSVVGLIAAGLEHVEDLTMTKQQVMPFMKTVFSLENRNASMNMFIGKLFQELRAEGIQAVLVKGQGIAQCYERPLWRACGDVDLLLGNTDYQRAKAFLRPLSTSIEHEGAYSKHLGLKIESWTVELHGSLRCGLSQSIDMVLDDIRNDILLHERVRPCVNDRQQVLLPGKDEDAIYVFSHVLKHFYKGGIGLRQVCDWCRMLWRYRGIIDVDLLASRLSKMRLTTEWKAFAAFVVHYLGMPADAMPLYSSSKRWKRKAKRIEPFILKVGNFGRNRDMSYYKKYPYLIRKTISLGRRCVDLFRHAALFPLDSIRFFPSIVTNGLCAAIRGE